MLFSKQRNQCLGVSMPQTPQSLEQYCNGSNVVTTASLCLFAQCFNKGLQPPFRPLSLMLPPYILVYPSDLLTVEGLEQSITSQQQDLIVLFLVGGNVRHCADHARESSKLPQFDFWVSDGAGDVEVAGEDAHLSEQLDVVDAALLLAVNLATVLDDPQLLPSLVRLVVPSQLQRTTSPHHHCTAVTQICHHYSPSHQKAYHCT